MFLVEQTPDQERHEADERHKSPVRTERDRRSEQIQQTARVHWMPDDRIRARRHHGLVRDHLNRRGGERVLLVDEEDEIETDRDERITGQDTVGWNRRPYKPALERRHGG